MEIPEGEKKFVKKEIEREDIRVHYSFGLIVLV